MKQRKALSKEKHKKNPKRSHTYKGYTNTYNIETFELFQP